MFKSVGYNGNPALSETLAYVGYLALVGWFIFGPAAPKPPLSYPEFLGTVFMRSRWTVTATAITASSTRTQAASTTVRAV